VKNAVLRSLAGLSLGAILVVVAAALVTASRQRAAETPQETTRMRQREAASRGGLQAAAAVTGVYVDSVGLASSALPASLSELVAVSHLVVTADIESNSCILTLDGHSIVTVMSMRVASTLKRDSSVQDSFTLVVPGGKVSFADGSTAELRPRGFAFPHPGVRYLLFLRRIEGSDAAQRPARPSTPGQREFVPAAGVISFFQLANDRKFILPGGGLDSAFGRWMYKEKFPVYSFLPLVENAVREAAGRGR
jgi:hypothetical protein